MRCLVLCCALLAFQACSCFDDRYSAYCAQLAEGCTGGGAAGGGLSSSGGGFVSAGGGSSAGGGQTAAGGGDTGTGGGAGGGIDVPDGGNNGPAAAMLITPDSASAGECSQFSLFLLNERGVPTRAASDVVVTLTVPGQLSFFTDVACQGTATDTVTVSQGEYRKLGAFRSTSFGRFNVSATAANLTSYGTSLLLNAYAQISIGSGQDTVVATKESCQPGITLSFVDPEDPSTAVVPSQGFTLPLTTPVPLEVGQSTDCSTEHATVGAGVGSVDVAFEVLDSAGPCTALTVTIPTSGLPEGLSPRPDFGTVAVYWQGYPVNHVCSMSAECCPEAPALSCNGSTSTCK